MIATETRPVLQGARLTTFELMNDGIPVTLIADTMVGFIMQKKMITKVIVGADRVTKQGHTFNKIGTYQIAVLAKMHRIPFFIAAPTSTLDLKSGPEDVIIEERNFEEITKLNGKRIAPKGVRVINPAFDMTPPEFISGLITERGVLFPPFHESISNIFSKTN